MKYFYFRYLQL